MPISVMSQLVAYWDRMTNTHTIHPILATEGFLECGRPMLHPSSISQTEDAPMWSPAQALSIYSCTRSSFPPSNMLPFRQYSHETPDKQGSCIRQIP